jgi:hypothetical protein
MFSRRCGEPLEAAWRISMAALTLLAVGSAGHAFERGQCLELARVDRWDFLYIRARPDYRSAKVGAISPDSASPIVITGRCTPAGAPPKQLWCPVKYYVTKDATRTGFVKAYFTNEIPCPPSLDFYQQGAANPMLGPSDSNE